MRGNGLQFEKATRHFIRNHLRGRKPRRLHLTDLPLEHFIENEQLSGYKPLGLWWGVGDSWMQWCMSEMKEWLCPYIYEIVLNEENVLRIDTIKKFEKFEEKYATVPPWLKVDGHDAVMNLLYNNAKQQSESKSRHNFSSHYIDYAKLSKEYGGIEIPNYFWEKRMSSMWYYGWDCASGCAWDVGAIKEIKLFASFDRDSGQFVKSGLQTRNLKV